ncbi:hypothetical protein NKH18_48460 [Streptomyces sp. M10(2022)]
MLATTNSAALTGLAFTLEWVPRLGAFALAGAMTDRYGTTRVFRLASGTRAVVVLAAALALPELQGGLSTTITVMALAALTGVLTEFSYIAAETAGGVASRAAGERAHRVQSVLLGIDQVGTLAGPHSPACSWSRPGHPDADHDRRLLLLACAFAPGNPPSSAPPLRSPSSGAPHRLDNAQVAPRAGLADHRADPVEPGSRPPPGRGPGHRGQAARTLQRRRGRDLVRSRRSNTGHGRRLPTRHRPVGPMAGRCSPPPSPPAPAWPSH